MGKEDLVCVKLRFCVYMDNESIFWEGHFWKFSPMLPFLPVPTMVADSDICEFKSTCQRCRLRTTIFVHVSISNWAVNRSVNFWRLIIETTIIIIISVVSLSVHGNEKFVRNNAWEAPHVLMKVGPTVSIHVLASRAASKKGAGEPPPPLCREIGGTHIWLIMHGTTHQLCSCQLQGTCVNGRSIYLIRKWWWWFIQAREEFPLNIVAVDQMESPKFEC